MDERLTAQRVTTSRPRAPIAANVVTTPAKVTDESLPVPVLGKAESSFWIPWMPLNRSSPIEGCAATGLAKAQCLFAKLACKDGDGGGM